MTLGESDYISLGHGQQLCKILSRPNMAVRSYGPGTNYGYVCTVTLTLEIWPWVKVMTHPLVMDNIYNCVKYYQDPTRQSEVMAWIQIFGTYAVWPWPWRYDLGSRSWHTFWSWITILCNIIKIQHGSQALWPGHRVLVHKLCSLTLTLEIWPWVKVMTHSLVMDNNFVKYYPGPTWQSRVVAQTRCEQMDGQTDRVIPIYPQTLFVGDRCNMLISDHWVFYVHMLLVKAYLKHT